MNRTSTLLLTSILTLMFILLLTLTPSIIGGEVLRYDTVWVEPLGLRFTLMLDSLALVFALLIVGIGAVVTLYAGYYFDDTRTLHRFYALLMPFVGAMLMLVLAGNVLLLFVAWELTGILSFLLISFNGDSEAARAGALRALIVTAGGGLALLTGLLLLSTGSLTISDILSTPNLHEHPLYTGFTLLILLGCFTKSAQFPFHFWLPGGMTAPSPASAYLHSATMVKAGVYLLLRLYPALGNTALWEGALVIVGLITMLVGAVLALRQNDLKALLAYATVSQLGALVALIGLPDGHGIEAAVIGVIAHALYKAALFLVAGSIEHSTGTRKLDQLGGLRTRLPVLTLVAALALLSMAGVPPLLGFVAKEALLHAVAVPALLVVLVSSALTVTAAWRVGWEAFGRPAHYDHFHAPTFGLTFAPGILAGLSLLTVLGLPMLTPLIAAITGHESELSLFPTNGLANPTFQLSLGVLCAGTLVFLSRRWWMNLALPHPPTFAHLYDGGMRVLHFSGDRLLRTQNGKLRHYLIAILISMGVFVLVANLAVGGLAQFSRLPFTFARPSVDALRTLMLVIALGGALASILFKRHLLAALALGLTGYAVGVIFILEPAPDVALVQFLVETLGTVLIILMITRIPVHQRRHMIDIERGHRAGFLRDMVIAGLIGTAVGLFALSAVSSRPLSAELNPPIVLWHIANTYGRLGVTDVVGGIVTDFRGMDTLFEITVFAMAALGVLTLLTLPKSYELLRGHRLTKLHLRSPNSELEALQDERVQSRLSTPLTRTIAKLILPFALLVALSQLLYGGTQVGDGFTAGVVSGLAVASWYVIFGYFEARERLSWLVPGRLIAFGLVLAFSNAVLPMLAGTPFLATLTFDGFTVAGLHPSSTLIFEIGIFLTVFGGMSTIMDAIAHPREVEREFYGDE